jgi:hypothetical protein
MILMQTLLYKSPALIRSVFSTFRSARFLKMLAALKLILSVKGATGRAMSMQKNKSNVIH